jgi:hypothetical protein
MKDSKTIEAFEKGVFECMSYMKDKIKDIIERLMEQNEENRKHAKDGGDIMYTYGVHDGLLDVLREFEIETDEEYYN